MNICGDAAVNVLGIFILTTATVVIGVTSECPSSLPNTVIYGKDTYEFRERFDAGGGCVQSPEACCSFCQQTSDCVAWRAHYIPKSCAVKNRNYGCGLMTSISSQYESDEYISGRKDYKGFSDCKASIFENKIFAGQLLDTLCVSTQDECCQRCHDDTKCKAWTYGKTMGHIQCKSQGLHSCNRYSVYPTKLNDSAGYTAGRPDRD